MTAPGNQAERSGHPVKMIRAIAFAMVLMAPIAVAFGAGSWKPLVRLGFGLGSTGSMFGGGPRLLVGCEPVPVLVGIQGLGFTGSGLESPANEDQMVHLLVSKELWHSGNRSIWIQGGGGVAQFVRRGERIADGWLGDEYEPVNSDSPSGVLALEFAISWRRHVGISLLGGGALNAHSVGFLTTQVDVGRW